MGWVLRLVETQTDSPGPNVDVMEIRPTRDLGDIAHLGLTPPEAATSGARAAGGGRRTSPRACGAAAGARTWAAKRANMRRMSKMQSVAVATFTAREREYIRRELDSFFSTLPSVAEGFQLKTWRGGPEAGKPKLSPTAAGLLDRGLMRLDTGQRLPRLFFTEAGLTALRAMMADRRLADPAKFGHIRQELGIDPVPDTDPPQE